MLGCGAASLLYNITHAVRHGGASTNWVNVLTAVIYGVAPVAVAMVTSHLATKHRANWEVLIMLAVMLAAMGMSITAASSMVRPVAGPVACWFFPAVLDTATLMAFRFIVVPYVAPRSTGMWLLRCRATGRASGPAADRATYRAAERVTGGTRTKAAAAPKAPAAPEAPAVQRTLAAAQNGSGPDATVLTLTVGGPVKQKMRKWWDEQIAAGKTPTGPDMNVACGYGRKYSLGKRYAQQWNAEAARAADAAGEPAELARETAQPNAWAKWDSRSSGAAEAVTAASSAGRSQ
jgi:hypothetical protein